MTRKEMDAEAEWGFDTKPKWADSGATLDVDEKPPAEHFGSTAERYRDDLIDDMAELYADCE